MFKFFKHNGISNNSKNQNKTTNMNPVEIAEIPTEILIMFNSKFVT